MKIPASFATLVAATAFVYASVAFTQEKAEKKPAETNTAAKPATKASAKEAEKPKGRVPANYAKLDLTTAQREKIYAIQSSYEPKIDELAEQIKTLMAERDADIEGVLTASQKEKLDSIRTANKEKAEQKKKELESKKAGETKDPAKPASETTKTEVKEAKDAKKE